MEFLQSNTKGESDRQLDGGGRKGCFMFFVCDRFQLVDGGWVVGFQEVDAWTEGGWDRDRGGWWSDGGERPELGARSPLSHFSHTLFLRF